MKVVAFIDKRTAQMASLAEVIAKLQEHLEAVELGRKRDAKLSLETLKQLHEMELELGRYKRENDQLRRAAKRMIAAGTTRDLRRKLQAVFDSVMGKES